MYTEKQTQKLLDKLIRFEDTLEPLMFDKVGEVSSVRKYQTAMPYDNIPEDHFFQECKVGDIWGGEWNYCWFKGTYTVDAALEGQNLYIYPKIGGYEAMLWVNGVPHGIFSTKISQNTHGNHYCDRIKTGVRAGEVIDLALEYYAHHEVQGTEPFSSNKENFLYTYQRIDICLKNEEICDFYFDLKTVNRMLQALPEDSFRRASLIGTMIKIHEIVYYDYGNTDRQTFLQALREAAPLLKEQLAKKNGPSAPVAAVIGHSHMDTAWLWHQGETLKKCARTYANQINLMEQYPEYLFIQSSTFHSQWIQEHYPALFEQIKQRVAEGRYEPNGGVYIECDCNIPSGESMIRQFLWGQRFTQKNFNYRADCFWLPDTFGYSASLPQIMKGCGIRYFLTTKLDWNDDNHFPYESFYWKGIDGSRVLVHLNRSHLWPEPVRIMKDMVSDPGSALQEKTVSNMRLFAYGFGDGGGGPQFEMIEMTRRIRDTEGIPKVEHMTVSTFMHRLETRLQYPSTYNGELYLELHRGTLTNQHTIKRNNRLAEIALHNLEYMTVRRALDAQEPVGDAAIHPLMGTLLKNQFHDILPGTGIPRVHQEAISEVSGVIAKAEEEIAREAEAMEKDRKGGDRKETQRTVTVANTLSFDRNDVVYLDYEDGFIVEGAYRQQIVTDANGAKKLAVAGIHIPAYASVVLSLMPGKCGENSPFLLDKGSLTTPLLHIVFNEKGYLESCVDRTCDRELRGEGYALNTFLIGEDVPKDWDNWDVDADLESKLKDRAELISRQIVSNGPVECRVRSTYKLTEKSTLTQDMIVYADSKEIRFETLMNWQDDHRFLKTAFDTTVFTQEARQEVQFGYLRRSTVRNTRIEKAKFEVSNHKYSDLSETRYGAALLNDCKYGISVENSGMHLSLHKGGNRPDYKGDKGKHFCSYAFLPHDGAFSAKTVIRPAYCFNVKHLILQGSLLMESLLDIDADDVIAETVKPAEDGGKAFVLRLYEAEGARTPAKLRLHVPVKSVELTNMLEEKEAVLESVEEIRLEFKPFEIKTLKIYY